MSFPQFARFPTEIKRLIINSAVTINLHSPIHSIAGAPPRFDTRGITFDIHTPRGADSCCGTCVERRPEDTNALPSTTAEDTEEDDETQPIRCLCRYNRARRFLDSNALWSSTCTCLDLFGGLFRIGGVVETWAREAYFGSNQFVVSGSAGSVLADLREVGRQRLGMVRSLVIDMNRLPMKFGGGIYQESVFAWKQIFVILKAGVKENCAVRIVMRGRSADERDLVKELRSFTAEIEKMGLRNVSIYCPGEGRWRRNQGWCWFDPKTGWLAVLPDTPHGRRHCDGCEACRQVKYADHLVTVYGRPVSLGFDLDKI